MAEPTRDEEIKAIHRDYAWFYRVLRGAMLIGIGILIGLIIYADPASRQAYAINVFTGVLSLGATWLIFDELNRKRSEDDLKRQLVDDAASISNEIAKNAVHQLRRKGWLVGEKGVLKQEDLSEAKLQEVVLQGANLQALIAVSANFQEAHLEDANIEGAILTEARFLLAHLERAKLKGAFLDRACLRAADLKWTNLQDANLEDADLDGANLQGADLRGTNLLNAKLRRVISFWDTDLRGANLTGADLKGAVFLDYAKFDEKTRMPTGNFWKQGTKLAYFADPNNDDDFWRSPDPASPAWRGYP